MSNLLHGGPANKLLARREGLWLALNMSHLLTALFFHETMEIILKHLPLENPSLQLLERIDEAWNASFDMEQSKKIEKLVSQAKGAAGK